MEEKVKLICGHCKGDIFLTQNRIDWLVEKHGVDVFFHTGCKPLAKVLVECSECKSPFEMTRTNFERKRKWQGTKASSYCTPCKKLVIHKAWDRMDKYREMKKLSNKIHFESSRL